jgi:hypothetical protein
LYLIGYNEYTRLEKERKMGRMAELEMDIVELLNNGDDAVVVAKKLSIPVEWVTDVEESVRGEEDDGQPSEYTEWQDYMGGDDSYDYSCEV